MEVTYINACIGINGLKMKAKNSIICGNLDCSEHVLTKDFSSNIKNKIN